MNTNTSFSSFPPVKNVFLPPSFCLNPAPRPTRPTRPTRPIPAAERPRKAPHFKLFIRKRPANLCRVLGLGQQTNINENLEMDPAILAFRVAVRRLCPGPTANHRATVERLRTLEHHRSCRDRL